MAWKVKSLSHVQLFATPWTVDYQAPPSMEFPRQEYWSGLPFPSPGDLSDPGIKPRSPTLQADALPSEPPVAWVAWQWSYCPVVFCFELPAQQPEDQGRELGEGTPGLYSLLFLFTHSFTLVHLGYCLSDNTLNSVVFLPTDYSLPGSSVHGIFQARILEGVAMPSFRESSRPRDQTAVSCISCIVGGFFTSEPPGKLQNSVGR